MRILNNRRIRFWAKKWYPVLQHGDNAFVLFLPAAEKGESFMFSVQTGVINRVWSLGSLLLVFYYFVDGESSSSSTTTAAAAAPIAAKPISTISIKRKADADAASPVKVGSFFRVVFSPTVPIGVF